ncbi:MAG: hypothetical protein WA125_16970 [Desulfosporosinus sp.]
MIELNYIEIQAFRKIGYGCLFSFASLDGANWQTDLLIHLSTKEIKSREMKTAKIEISVELREINGFPLVRMPITIHDYPGDPCKMEVFFNLIREDHIKCAASLTAQKTVRIHFFGDNLKYSHSKEIRWYLQNDVANILIKAAPMAQSKKDADFELAKAKFMEENEL